MSACGKPVKRLAASAPSVLIAAQRACNSWFGWSSEPCRMTCGSIADDPGHVLIGGVLDRPRGRRAGGDRQYDLGPFPLGEIEIGAEPRPGATIGLDRRLVIKRAWTMAEALERRRHRRKGVGLV